jgi:CCR4-NOT transcription complex subunit 6
MKDLIAKYIPSKFMHYINQKPLINFVPGNLFNYKNKFLQNINKSVKSIFPCQNSISLFTWNILASGYTSPTVYYYVSPEYLDENHRFNIISYDILSSNCDVICLQEVEKRIYDKLTKITENEYKGIYEKRSGLTCDGLCLLYKSSKFTQVHYELINLNKISFNVEKIMNTDILTKMKKLPMTHNIAQLIVLEPNLKEIKSKIDNLIIINLHLYWDPDREIIKFIQIYEILNKVKDLYTKLKSENKRVGVFLCGDFNSMPDSNVLDFIQGKLDIKKIDANLMPLYLKLNSVLKDKFKDIDEKNNFKIHNSHEGNQYLTNIKPDFTGTLDHIFYTNEDFYSYSEVSNFETTNFIKESALPNSFHGSDHIFLISKFYV